MPFELRPNILRMHAYSPGKPIEEVKRELGLDTVIKLASNENPLGPSPKAIEAVERAAKEMHLYPDASAYVLRQALSKKMGVAPERILLGNGSDELIHLLGLVFLGDGNDEVLVGDPSFVRYDAAAQIADCKLSKIPLRDHKHDLQGMLEAASTKTKLVFIANPNNPTGTIVSDGELRSFLDSLPSETVTVLDEAYFEYATGDASYPDSTRLIDEGYRVVGLRTLSKAYGLAGVRLGYGFAAPEIVDAINRAREPFSVNALAQAAAIAALGDEQHLAATLETNAKGLAKLTRTLLSLGISIVPSHANFLYVELGQPARPLFESLLRDGIIVRTLPQSDALRISVGTGEEMDRLIDRLKAHWSALPAHAASGQ